MSRASVFFLFAAVSLLAIPGCGNIEGLSLPYVASPRVEVQTPESPAEGNIAIAFQLVDREVEPADITVEYSTNGGTTYSTATLTVPGDATNLSSAWHPGITHTVTWNSVTDMVGRSGAVSVCVKITPSDASNPSGTPGISGSFTVNNIAYNEAPAATAATPAGVQSGNVQINYFLADVESDTCSITVLYSTNGGTSYQAATMGPAGDGTSGLSSSPSGTAHVYLWDSRADNVAPSGQVDTVKIRITPTDFNAGTAGDTNSFSVDNSVANDPPTVAITGGPADGSTVTTTQVAFTWSGSDTDGSVVGYYYSFDHDPPDVWTTGTTITSGALSAGGHIFRVVSVDDDSDLSAVASRSFTVSIPGTITADFSGSPLSGPAPLTVNFTDLSTATNGIDTWSWNFGNGDVSTSQHPACIYTNPGTFTVSLTVTGPDGTDMEMKTNYITVTAPSGDTIYIDGVSGDDGRDGLSWANSVQTIQTGLDKASDDWMVLVADGTYTGTSNKDLDFAGKAIHLKSVGGAAACIIDCETSGRGFYFHTGETNDAVVDGFTIQKGSAPGNGGGICCENDASPTITNCDLNNNTAGGGGGVFCYGYYSSPTIANCVIQNNTAGSGGGIYCDLGSPTIADCTIMQNQADYGGGICAAYECSQKITRCVIMGNSANNAGGGIITAGSLSGTIINCTIVDNSATNNGAGIWYANSCNTTITNCIIANNSAGNAGGGIYSFQASTPILNNTILWGNSATNNGNEIYTSDSGSSITLNYCDYTNGSGDVEGSGTVTPDANCLTLDPLFENATAQDYHLQDISPCVDAGDNSLIPPGVTTDLDGNMRIYNTTVDIGAYEYGSTPAPTAWARSYGGASDDYANSIRQTTDGGYVVAGHTGSFGAGIEDFWVLKLSSAGALQWQKTYGGADHDYARSIWQTTDGAYIVAGSTYSFGAGSTDFWVIKLSSAGALQWQKTYGGAGYDRTYSIQQTTDGGYIVAGLTNSFGAGNDDFWVLKLSSAGALQWQKSYGGANWDCVYSIQQTTDGGYVVAGRSDSFGAGNDDFWVLKLGGDGAIAFNAASGAQMTDTSVTPVDSSAVVTDTSVTGADTSATVTDTSVVPVDSDATVEQQAP